MAEAGSRSAEQGGPDPRELLPLGSVERSAAGSMVHPGAVYLHDGRVYRVEALDLEAGVARVRPADGSEYTRASSHVDLNPTRVAEEAAGHGTRRYHGELEVRSRVTGYRRIRFKTHETIGWGDVELPEQRHLAGGYWFTLDEETVARLKEIGTWRHDPVRDRGPNWERQAGMARQRDGERCRLCNAPKRGGRAHDVHHIRPFRSFGWVPGQNQNYLAANALDNLITLCKACHRRAERALGLHGGLQGLGHALGHIAPLYLMCDRADIGVKTEASAPWTGRPTVAVYEHAAAGVGFGEALFQLHDHVLDTTAELIQGCDCQSGCPSCVGPVGLQGPELGPDAKAHAMAVLSAIGAGGGS